jgi:hypothetical protein
MRVGIFLLVWLCLAACCLAQSANFEDSEMYKRWDSSRNKAMAAINAGAEGKPDKKDPELENSLAGKKFQSGGLNLGKKTEGVEAYLYEQKVSSSGYKMTRSFLGLKNPWFGRKVYVAKDASLFSKSLIPNVDREVEAGTSMTREYYQAEKVVKTDDEIVKTQTFLGQGVAQGSLDKVTDRIGKEMTIEQVRELLNKGRSKQ